MKEGEPPQMFIQKEGEKFPTVLVDRNDPQADPLRDAYLESVGGIQYIDIPTPRFAGIDPSE